MSQQVVPKLSATKQKLSLGEVKKTEKANARKFVRTTVVNPDDIDWPLVTEKDERELMTALSADLKMLMRPNIKVPPNVISKIPKGERRDYRRKWQSEQALEVGIDVAGYKKIRNDVAIGVNCVTTGLEQEHLGAVIIDKDVDPPMLTKLVLPIARCKGIPIVAVSGLKKTCNDVFKTKCIAIGFKNRCKDPGHPFNRIYSTVATIGGKCSQEFSDSFQLDDSLEGSNSSVIRTTGKTNKVGEKTGKPGEKRGCTLSETFKPPKIRKV